MAEFIYTTSANTSGPWLIEADKLESLDRTLNDEWERITKYNENMIQKLIAQELEEKCNRKNIDKGSKEAESFKKEIEIYERSKGLYRDNRSITIYLEGNKKVIVKTFNEALRQQSLLEELPTGFNAVIQSGNIKGEIELREKGNLTINTSPEHLPESREMFAAFKRWSSTVDPPKWQQLWVKLIPLQWVLWLIVLVIMASIFDNSASATKKYYQQQAEDLLSNGLSHDKQLKAIETILALQSGYISKVHSVERPGWYKLLLYGGLVVCIILSITPSNSIGIGKGQHAIQRWQLWLRFVFVIVPGFAFVNIIWPYLSKVLPSLF